MAVVSGDPIGTLQDLERDDELRFAVNRESTRGCVRRVYVGESIIWVILTTPDERIIKIETQWANGWLEPLVDEYHRPRDELVPIGCLGEIERLAPELESDEAPDTRS
jgi:hypothetical protein